MVPNDFDYGGFSTVLSNLEKTMDDVPNIGAVNKFDPAQKLYTSYLPQLSNIAEIIGFLGACGNVPILSSSDSPDSAHMCFKPKDTSCVLPADEILNLSGKVYGDFYLDSNPFFRFDMTAKNRLSYELPLISMSYINGVGYNDRLITRKVPLSDWESVLGTVFDIPYRFSNKLNSKTIQTMFL